MQSWTILTLTGVCNQNCTLITVTKSQMLPSLLPNIPTLILAIVILLIGMLIWSYCPHISRVIWISIHLFVSSSKKLSIQDFQSLKTLFEVLQGPGLCADRYRTMTAALRTALGKNTVLYWSEFTYYLFRFNKSLFLIEMRCKTGTN